MKKNSRSLVSVLPYLALAVALTASLGPFLWAVLTSLRSGTDLFSGNLWPREGLRFDNYVAVFGEQPFGRYIVNSALTATLTVACSLGLGVLAACALGRADFRGRGALLVSFLAVSLFPQVAILSGLFEVITVLGLYNSVTALTLTYTTFTLPFTVWTLTAFARGIPREIEEAALLDGARGLTLIVRILLPLMAPAVVTTGLLAFIAAWNEFLFALTFTLTDKTRTVPVALALMSGASQFEFPWGNVMAASVVVTLPVVGLVVLFQKRIVAGLTAGALKS